MEIRIHFFFFLYRFGLLFWWRKKCMDMEKYQGRNIGGDVGRADAGSETGSW